MKYKVITLIIGIVCSFNICAQKNTFRTTVYYSTPDEITFEVQNLIDKEMVILLDMGSHINFYDIIGQYKSGEIVNHPLRPTDSLNILIRIPSMKTYLAKYKVKSKVFAKTFLDIRYTYDFESFPANTEWKNYSQEMDILAYDQLRRSVNKNRLVKKEMISGDYVYSNPDIKPEFPGGEKALRDFLEKETSFYSYNSGDQGYIRVRVVIENDGAISHPYLIMGKNPYFQKAALEIIKRMPKWKPGISKGKPVRSFCVIPVLFRLI